MLDEQKQRTFDYSAGSKRTQCPGKGANHRPTRVDYMSVRVLTWNLNGRAPVQSWEYVDRFLGADVMFVQEAVATTGQGFGPDQWL